MGKINSRLTISRKRVTVAFSALQAGINNVFEIDDKHNIGIRLNRTGLVSLNRIDGPGEIILTFGRWAWTTGYGYYPEESQEPKDCFEKEVSGELKFSI